MSEPDNGERLVASALWAKGHKSELNNGVNSDLIWNALSQSFGKALFRFLHNTQQARGLRKVSTSSLAMLLILLIILSNVAIIASMESTKAQGLTVVGQQKIVVLLMKFQDITGEPDPPSHYTKRIFSEMNDYYSEASFGQVYLSGRVYGWYRLPQPWSHYVNSQYPYGNRQAMMEDSIRTADADVDFRSFRYCIIVFNNHLVAPPMCCVAFAEGDRDFQTGDGLARLGVVLYPVTEGDPAHAPLGVFTHELAHNLGLVHSLSGNWDIMSGCNGPLLDKPPHPISWSKIRLGWVGSAQVRTVLPGESATVEIQELETQSSSYQVVKVPLANGTCYFIEARKFVGFDAYLPGEGVLVSHVDENRKEPSHLVDANPSTSTLDDAAWQVGQTFRDSANGISVAIRASSRNSYTVLIARELGTQKPSIGITGAAAKSSILVRETVSVTVTISNTGDGGARNVEFSAKIASACLEHISPGGTVPMGSRDSLAPGESAQLRFEVRGKAEGRGEIGAWVVYHDSQGNRYDSSTLIVIVVEARTTTAATTTIVSQPQPAQLMLIASAIIAAVVVAGILFDYRKSRAKKAGAEAKQVVPPVPVVQNVKPCIRCKAELPADARFCDNCGASQASQR